tara:strand:+ start:736 stop:963 length:228 start_codon:yes stop_codon:yes gene_type:complete
MLKSQELEKVIRKFNDQSPVAMDARVSIETPDGTMWDVGQIFLAENKIVGYRETHRIVIRVNRELASPGSVIRKI